MTTPDFESLWSQLSLSDVDKLWREREITEAQAIAYIRMWNAGPHFTRAVLYGSFIGQFDPETDGHRYRHLEEKFNLRLNPT